MFTRSCITAHKTRITNSIIPDADFSLLRWKPAFEINWYWRSVKKYREFGNKTYKSYSSKLILSPWTIFEGIHICQQRSNDPCTFYRSLSGLPSLLSANLFWWHQWSRNELDVVAIWVSRTGKIWSGEYGVWSKIFIEF